MKTFKSLLFLLLISCFFTVNAGDEANNKSSEFGTVQLDESLNFEVKNVEGKLHMTWEPTDIDNFKWYKIVKSQTNSNPSYPEDSGIKYYDSANKSEFYSYSPRGTTYYRLCVITHDNERFCSRVAKIVNESSDKKGYSYKNYEKKDYSSNKKKSSSPNLNCAGLPGCSKDVKSDKKYSTNSSVKDYKSNMSSSKKLKLKRVVSNFVKRLESKGYDGEKMVVAIDRVIERLEALVEKKPKHKEVVSYLIVYLNEYKEKYEDDWSDIEAIFSEE